jgi:hypothetical protein
VALLRGPSGSTAMGLTSTSHKSTSRSKHKQN